MFVTFLYTCIISGQETNNYEMDMTVCNRCKWFGPTFPVLGCENDWAPITCQ